MKGHYHELFLRGRRDLCDNILRRQIKGTRTRKPDDPESEPDFYLPDFQGGTAAAMNKEVSHCGGFQIDMQLSPFIPSTLLPPSAISSQSTGASAEATPWFPPVFTGPLGNSSQQQQLAAGNDPSFTAYPDVGQLLAALRAAGGAGTHGFAVPQSTLPSNLIQYYVPARPDDTCMISQPNSGANAFDSLAEKDVALTGSAPNLRPHVSEKYEPRENRTYDNYATPFRYGINPREVGETTGFCLPRRSSPCNDQPMDFPYMRSY